MLSTSGAPSAWPTTEVNSSRSIVSSVAADAETLYAIHRESAIAAYVQIFPPDRYRFPDDEMSVKQDGFARFHSSP